MISEIRPLPAGTSLQVWLVPPAGAQAWRILRKGSAVFSGYADAQALVVYEGQDTIVVDAMPGLINEAPVFYCAYFWVDDAWVASTPASGTPRATYDDRSTDALSLVRDRIEEGFKVEIDRGTFVLPDREYIQVLTAPPLIDQTEPPMVTVHLESDASGARGVGELITTDYVGVDGQWRQHEGWLADVTLEIIGWSINPDERIELRKALRRIIVANLPVFDAAGLTEITFSQRDAEFLNNEFGANIYQTTGIFNCQAPVIVVDSLPPVSDVVVSGIAVEEATAP